MSANNASTQHDNSIKRITIVGAGGQMGSKIVEELQKNPQFELTALTRPDSNNPVPKGVNVKHIDYNNHTTLVEGMKGTQVLIITMAVQAPPGQEEKLIDAAADAKVDWVVPNNWGYDVGEDEVEDHMLGPQFIQRMKYIKGKGLKTISFPSGYWYEYSLSGGLPMFGIDSIQRKARLYNGGNTPLSTSTWERTSLAVAKVLSLPIHPSEGKDASLTISKWTDDCVRTPSFTLTQRQMLDEVHKVLGTTDADWEIENADPQKVFQEGIAIMQKGERIGFAQALYSKTFFIKAPGDMHKHKRVDTDVLDLPKEDLSFCTQRAVQFAKDEYIPKRFAKMSAEEQGGHS